MKPNASSDNGGHGRHGFWMMVACCVPDGRDCRPDRSQGWFEMSVLNWMPLLRRPKQWGVRARHA